MMTMRAYYLPSTVSSNPKANPEMHELLNEQSLDNQHFVTKHSQALHLGNILQTNLKIILNNEHS